MSLCKNVLLDCLLFWKFTSSSKIEGIYIHLFATTFFPNEEEMFAAWHLNKSKYRKLLWKN